MKSSQELKKDYESYLDKFHNKEYKKRGVYIPFSGAIKRDFLKAELLDLVKQHKSNLPNHTDLTNEITRKTKLFEAD